MFGEFVVVAQPFAVQHACLVEDNRVLQAASEHKPGFSQRFDVLHETESAGAAYFLGVRVLGEVDDDLAVLGPEHWMREVDREIELETMIGLEARPFVVLAHLDRLLDAHVALERGLLLDAG